MMRFSLGLSLVAAFALSVAAPHAADAGFHLYYSEDFSGQDLQGIAGPVPPFGANPTSFSNISGSTGWSVDGAFGGGNPDAILRNSTDVARVSGSPGTERFRFRDVGGNSGGVPGTGSVTFQTATTTLGIGNPGNFIFLDMTLNASINGIAPGSMLVVESYIDNVMVEQDTFTSVNSNFTVTHDLTDDISPMTNHSYFLRVIATQSLNATFSIDDILVSGVSTPEPASMSLLGMGVVAMCGAGYRRRRNAATVEA